jgi:hypothetical protein
MEQCSEASAYKIQTPENLVILRLPAYEDETHRVFRNVGI